MGWCVAEEDTTGEADGHDVVVCDNHYTDYSMLVFEVRRVRVTRGKALVMSHGIVAWSQRWTDGGRDWQQTGHSDDRARQYWLSGLSIRKTAAYEVAIVIAEDTILNSRSTLPPHRHNCFQAH